MPFQSCPKMASVAIHGTNNGKQIANVLHAKFADTYSAADIMQLANNVAAAVSGNYEPLMSANLLLTDVTVTGLEFINDLQNTNSLGASAGSASGDPLPANNSLVCTLRSRFTGRSARGRIYTFPTGASNLASTGGDLYETAYADAVLAFWQSVSDAINSDDWTHVILSRVAAGSPRTVGEGFTVQDLEMRNSTNDSQRRRLPTGH